MGVLSRLAVSGVAGIGVAVAAALVVALIDLYLAGHGYASITREVISWEPAGVHLSFGDLGMLLAAAAAAGSTWHLAVPGD